jgi:hypothetical protein
MKVYKITFWRFIKPSINIIVTLIFFLGFMGILMLSLHYRDGHIPIFLVVLTIFMVLLFCVPNIILHVDYFKEDRKKELSIDFIHKKVTLSRNGDEKVFFLKDIVKVVRISVRSSETNEFKTTAPWRYFYYYKIELQDGSSLFLTRFVVPNIEKVIPNLNYECLHQRFPIVKNI